MSREFENKLCVITGGSSGIGYSIAELLADQGARLLLIARDEAALQRAAGALRQRGAREVAILSADIADAAQRQRIAPALARLGEAPDAIFNAAGVVSGGLLDEIPLAEWERLFGINVFGLVGVLDAMLPAMRRQAAASGRGGRIVNIASMAGLTGMPGMSAYCASKFAVLGLGESLAAELDALGISVTTVCPSFVRTPIADKVRLFGRMDDRRVRKGLERLFTRHGATPEAVARDALRGATRRQALVVTGRGARGSYWAKRFAPLLVRRLSTRFIHPAFTGAGA